MCPLRGPPLWSGNARNEQGGSRVRDPPGMADNPEHHTCSGGSQNGCHGARTTDASYHPRFRFILWKGILDNALTLYHKELHPTFQVWVCLLYTSDAAD